MVDRPLSPRAAAKRDQISEAAHRLFTQLGYAGTSMDAVTAAAGVSKQTLYRYYESKERLLSDVLRRRILQLTHGPLSQVMAAYPPRNPAELEAILLQLAEAIAASLMNAEYLALVRIILSEIHRFPQLGSLFRESVPVRVLQTIAALLEGARQNGAAHIADGDVEMAARLFAGPILTYVLLDGLMVGDGAPRLPGREALAQLVRIYIRSVAP